MLAIRWSWTLYFCHVILVGRMCLVDRMFGFSDVLGVDRFVADGQRVAPPGRQQPEWLPYVRNANVCGVTMQMKFAYVFVLFGVLSTTPSSNIASNPTTTAAPSSPTAS